ncbi:MAG TPA: AcvB/VirJ family lysyl-phosphatidylglycerol hydrolase [Steroidobacteraceae bacterium]|nr:AcvB/VirJ family lysyl-phosphatidylglycerol hydrolase [Steroidobacteraceae bacterium]
MTMREITLAGTLAVAVLGAGGARGADPAAPAPGTGLDAPAPKIAGEQKLHYGAFGEVTIYRPAAKVTSVALFVSGDGGWNLGVVDMARHLLEQGAAVVGIDIRSYRKALNTPGSACKSLAVDFEGLAHEVEQRLKLGDYLPPVLVGYSSGATLVYATVVEAPKGTFAGALSLGFCPDLDVTQKICRGSGLEYAWQYAKGKTPAPVEGVLFSAAKGNVTPWIALQGDADQVCSPAGTRSFVAATGSAELVWLPKVGHGFSVEKNWLAQFRSAYARLAAHAAPPKVTLAEVQDLPLVEVPAAGAAPAGAETLFAVLLTGDGGWAGIDQDVAGALAAHGIPVVGWNSLKYYWSGRTPETAARDLERIVRRYAAAWHRPQVLLVGYSFGADVLPFLYTRLPAELKAEVRSVNLLALSDSASFEFHVADWIPGADSGGRPTLPEIARMGDAHLLCLYGATEGESPCRTLHGPTVTSVALSGGHHFDGDYGALANQILEHARR